MNTKGQFSIIAALLVAVILITTVIITYSTIRSGSTIQNQPSILSAIDETNLALKEILGFTVGYYGSVLQVTGNVSYAKTNATSYLQSGLQNVANMHPEWGASLNLSSSALQANWFSSTSYSSGNLTVNYNLPGLGIQGISYQCYCQLSVQIINVTGGQACLSITQDKNQPLVTLGMQNFNFYYYNNASSTWTLLNPTTEPTAYANGSYYINVPSGINPYFYVVEVEDQRGIIVVASSFNSYASTLAWNSTQVPTGSPSQYYVNNYNSSVDSLPDIGTHSNFTAQKNADGIYDNITGTNVPITSGDTQQFVQSNSSDVDGNGNIGTASNFTTEQYTDNIYDTLMEGDVPATTGFGNNASSTPSSYSSIPVNSIIGENFTSPAGAEKIYNISFYGRQSGSGTTHVKAIITDNSGNIIGTSLVLTTNTTAQWMTANFASPVSISPSTVYVLAVTADTSSFRLYYSASSGGWEDHNGTKFSYSSPSSPITWAHTNATDYCIYVNCTQANYNLDLERQWTSALYNANGSELLCIKTGNMSSEALEVDVWTGSWTVLNTSLNANAWNNISVSSYLTNATFTIRFVDTITTNDTVQSTWQIDSVLLHTWNITNNYKLELEEQWTNVNYTNAQLCIKTGSLAAKALAVDAWNGSAWINVLASLNANSWNNVTVSSYLQPSTFTIRFNSTDTVQDSWQIDAALLAVWPTVDLYSLSPQGTIVVELLQNGTMRWLGQSLVLTNSNSTLPFPPVPVRSIHVNETINGVNGEVPFQIEDWASAYNVPLGLTSNMSIFSSRTMLVFLATANASKVTIWWNGSDTATQTPFAYTNRYFSDSASSGTLSNGLTALQIQGNFVVTSTVGGSSSTANFMRINSNVSSYGSLPSYVITNGVVRDIVHQEAEWPNQTNTSPGGVINCSDIYADIVLTLPANATYYTYQLSLMFVQSQQNRTISDLCPVWLTSLTGQVQTENGTANGLPNVSNSSDLFYNYSASVWAHHWSQSISGTNSTGIMFTDSANQNLYLFDSIKGVRTGALGANSTLNTMQLLPVTLTAVSFNQTLDPRMQDIIWYGAIVTFNTTTTPIYNNTNQTGLWILVEYPPTVAVTGENN